MSDLLRPQNKECSAKICTPRCRPACHPSGPPLSALQMGNTAGPKHVGGEHEGHMSSMRSNMEQPADKLRKQVSTLAKFGGEALRSGNIGDLLQRATQLVSEAIEVDLVKVLQLLPDGQNFLVRAGVNWRPGVVGHATIPAQAGSAAGFALQTAEPVISEDITAERRFRHPELLFEHNVKSTVNVLICGDDRPFGVLEVDSRQLCRFGQDDIDFLQNYANLLAAAIDRVNAQQHLAESAQNEKVLLHELQHRINNMLTTIRAVARQTRMKSANLDEFAKAFDNRLAAIARTHSLLGRAKTGTLRLREILAQELSAQGAIEGENLTQDGARHHLVFPAGTSVVYGVPRTCD